MFVRVEGLRFTELEALALAEGLKTTRCVCVCVTFSAAVILIEVFVT